MYPSLFYKHVYIEGYKYKLSDFNEPDSLYAYSTIILTLSPSSVSTVSISPNTP